MRPDSSGGALCGRRAVLTGLLVAATGCGRPRGTTRLVIATGQRGGVYFDYGEGLAAAISAEYPDLRPEVITTGASLDNLRLVAGGRADVAFTLADSAALAVAGEAPFAAPQEVRALARLYDNYVHLVVRAGSGIVALGDLRGQRVSCGAAGSGTEIIARRLLALARLEPDTVERLDLARSAAALASGSIDAFFFSGGLPTQTISELAGRRLVRLVDLRDHAEPMRRRHGEFYSPRTIPASAYGLPACGSIGVPDYLVVRQDMAEDLSYELTGLLFSDRDALERAHPEARRLNVRSAFATDPVPLHKGAIRYYRESRS
ncbi:MULTISPECIES: TAXI family TRAP transporter solute-binding subunit [Nonomuraea]|uniref:TAXI family TRAP transporter solute-binding subunit n=1 Tax=Nonomuraea mangrovi TaxID=2316207 RepID=A0ABW4SRM3_9ACTN